MMGEGRHKGRNERIYDGEDGREKERKEERKLRTS